MASSEAVAVRSSAAGSPHIGFMDGMRGIAVLMVLVYHLKEALASDLHLGSGPFNVGINTFAGAGFMGVEVFFFISGFVLFYPYARTLFEGKPLQTVAHFADRRALKILPSYLFSLTFMTLFLLVTLPRPLDVVTSLRLLQNFGLHLVFAHSISKATFFAINGPLWSLAVEIQFYLIFPLVAWAFRRWALATPLVLIALAQAYRWHLEMHGGASNSFYVYQLPGFLDLFAFGMASSYLTVMFRARFPQLARWWPLFTIISLLAAAGLNAMFASLVHSGGGPAAWHWQNTFRPIFGVLLGIFATAGMLGAPLWQKIVANRVFVYLAFISYNLYLWNKFVILWVVAHWLPFFGNWPHSTLIANLLPFACALLIGIAATYLIERPFLDHGWAVLSWRVPRKLEPNAPSTSPSPDRPAAERL
ncbi:MAG TPA: acyltransferase [Candidatus Eremiobacteraceae bacterium]|nr:acyltransferase [Candidatus Eremiobacteraceae bacterium]